MAHDARHKLDGRIKELTDRINKETCPIEQDKLMDIQQVLMEIRAEDLQEMDQKTRRTDVWQQRYDNDTADLY